ncbi:MAG: DNA mismatch repair endonuclease MutL, partial [Planctomycetota bacterium]
MTQTKTPRRAIQRLSPELVNQIAAGEVIERPASALKELVENSLDAGARSIDVVVEGGGLDLIQVLDDGQGIPKEQLALAVASHATSKLSAVDELFRIRSLGFRGEALASIGSVAELTVTAAQRGADGRAGQAHAIEVKGGKTSPVRPAALGAGTKIEVRNLFFNTPARRKFLRAPKGELRLCADALTRLALGAPHVRFRLRGDAGRVVFEAPAGRDRLARIADLFGQEVAADLVELDAERAGMRLTGYVALPRRTRGNGTQQFTTLTIEGGEAHRPIRDRVLVTAVKEGYRGFLMTRRFPIVFLDLTVPADAVDVNVHPQKLEVRFRQQREVFALIVSAVRSTLEAHEVLPALTARPGEPGGAGAASAAGFGWRSAPADRAGGSGDAPRSRLPALGAFGAIAPDRSAVARAAAEAVAEGSGDTACGG